MKKISLLLITFSISAMLMAQQKLAATQQAVQQTVIKLFDAFSTVDTAALKQYSTADIKFYEYGQVWTLDTMIQKMIPLMKVADYKRTNKLDFVSTTINRNIAWATYHLQSEITRNTKTDLVKWMETVILVKEKNQWKIKVLHSTLVKRN
jgi:SnoaL-like domain